MAKKITNNSWKADAVCNTFKPHCMQVSLGRKYTTGKNLGKLTVLSFGKGGKNPKQNNNYISEKSLTLIVQTLHELKENIPKPNSATVFIPLAYAILTTGGWHGHVF